MTLTTTQGTSVMHANPRFSCIREKPGPLVAVMALAPARDAPMIAPMDAILVLHLDEGAPYPGQALGHGLADLRGRGDGIARKKAAARAQRAFHHGFVALEQSGLALV